MSYFNSLKVNNFPLTAFGELSTAENTPQVQIKFPYGINTDQVQVLTNNASSSVSASSGLCTITCAGAAEAFSQIRTFEVVRYGAGQGLNAKFTAGFTTGVANSSQVAGPGDDDEGVFFGYNGTSFGILHRKHGELEQRNLQITAGAGTGSGNITITMDGTAVVVAVTVSDTIAEVVAKIVASSADFFNSGRGWEVYTPDNINIIFTSLVSENASGTFSFVDTDTTGVTAGTFTQGTTAVLGVAPTETWTAQASWNTDVMDGTGISGVTLDPTKINIYNIDLQYLGAGNIFCSIEDKETGRTQLVHLMKHAGTLTAATFTNPTFHLNIIAKTESGYSGGALAVTTASLGGFIQGKETITGVRESALASCTSNGATRTAALVLHNVNSFQGRFNKVQVYPDHLTLINAATKDVEVILVENPTEISGTMSLQDVDANASVMQYDDAGTTVIGGKDIITFVIPASSSKDVDIEHLGLVCRPGSRLAFAVVKTTGGADGVVTVGTSWLERI